MEHTGGCFKCCKSPPLKQYQKSQHAKLTELLHFMKRKCDFPHNHRTKCDSQTSQHYSPTELTFTTQTLMQTVQLLHEYRHTGLHCAPEAKRTLQRTLASKQSMKYTTNGKNHHTNLFAANVTYAPTWHGAAALSKLSSATACTNVRLTPGNLRAYTDNDTDRNHFNPLHFNIV
ncbi:hypothetical protein ABVT39_025580 [Epinephelus coioides]